MSMFKKLKSIFVVEEDDKQGKTKGSATADKNAPPSPSGETTIKTDKMTQSDHTAQSKTDTKFVDLLLKAIEANNIEGFDYLEFKQSVQSLSKVEPDEAKRFKNAFVMANTMGLTKEKLFSSAKHYVSVLDKEEKKFAEAFNSQKDKQVIARKEKGKLLEQSIKEKEAQIKKLQAEIEKEKKQLGNVEADIAKALAKVEATKDGFYSAYHMVLQQIKDDLDKISSYV